MPHRLSLYDADNSGSLTISGPGSNEETRYTIGNSDNGIIYRIIRSGSLALSTLYITASGDNPRIGVGTTSPKSTFDFKDIEDSALGTELLLRSSRTSEGAQVGDSAGKLNFTIDSSSYGDLKTSGSIASIQTFVDSVDPTGVTGEFIIGVSNAKSNGPVDRFKISSTKTEITGNLDVSGDISSSGALFISGAESFIKSLKVGSTTPLGTSTLAASGLVTFTDNVNLGNSAVDEINITGITTITGNITASGNISSSGELIGIINGGIF